MIVYSAPVDLDTFERQRREYLQANPNTRWPRLTAPETEIAELLAAADNMGGGTVATGQALRGPPGFAGRLMGVELVVEVQAGRLVRKATQGIRAAEVTDAPEQLQGEVRHLVLILGHPPLGPLAADQQRLQAIL